MTYFGKTFLIFYYLLLSYHYHLRHRLSPYRYFPVLISFLRFLNGIRQTHSAMLPTPVKQLIDIIIPLCLVFNENRICH
jgi:hypothetical protein